MSSVFSQISRHLVLYVLSGCLIFVLSILRIHLRLQTTLVGYEIGKIKETEIQLRDRQSELKMLHAKVSTLKHLNLMSQLHDDGHATSGQIAQK